jgi:hypothetical protein
MSDHSETTAISQVTTQELAEVIAELEQYRERLLSETLTAAKRAKLPSSKALAQLEPQLAQIDIKLQQWRELQASLNTDN